MAKYVIGIDLGTLSARALLTDAADGRELAQSVREYPHGVMDTALWDGQALPPDWALQHPADYLACIGATVHEVLRLSGVSPRDVIALGLDCTACTVLPVDEAGTPLCLLDAYAHVPHAYVKLWKHHGAEAEARRLTALALERNEPWLPRYGGKVSSEWLYSKIWNVLREAPEVYAAADRFMEAADWIVYSLTGVFARNACCAGYKGMWSKADGDPSPAFFAAADPRLARIVEEKIKAPVLAMGQAAGVLHEAGARLLGLLPGTVVAAPIIDAHAGVPAANIARDGEMVMTMGTSTCHMMVSEREVLVPGICGVVADGILPGLYGYEAGQACVGDHFSWFVENCLPASYRDEAAARGMTAYELLAQKAEPLGAGGSGLLALDWWNGCRSTLVDASLTGAIFGLTLNTKPEHIYRALIEATAFGTRVILDNFAAYGVPVTALYACGGLSRKNPLLMQIYADVLHRPIAVCDASQGPALGAAILAAAAAGRARGGYDTVRAAIDAMGKPASRRYLPNAAEGAVYDGLFSEYRTLYNTLGRAQDSVLKTVKQYKHENQ